MVLKSASALLACIALLVGFTHISASPMQQMEIRKSEEYNAEQFAKSKPAVGEKAPELELQTLDGEPVKLSDYLGKNVVVIKAGYT